MVGLKIGTFDMLKNYYKDLFGVIHQKEVKKFEKDYATQYNDYGELSNYMAYLRYGYMIGVLGRIPYSIVDVGYGNGAFLNVCKETIKNCYGYDISDYPVPEGCKKIDNNFFQKDWYQYYDVITFFDSLEHFENIEFIRDLDCRNIIVSVPNCEYSNDKEFEDWKHRRENEHLHHFDYYSLRNFFDYAGWKVLGHSKVEDLIRKNGPKCNILTMVFERK
jgi:hypothetical protein